MSQNIFELIPVFRGEVCIEKANPSRVRELIAASNCKAVRARKTRKIIRLQMMTAPVGKVPVCAGGEWIEDADLCRVRELLKSPNVKPIRDKGRIIQLQVTAFGDDYLLPERQSNPLRYSHDSDTENNPVNVWTLKHLPDFALPVFRAVLESCAA